MKKSGKKKASRKTVGKKIRTLFLLTLLLILIAGAIYAVPKFMKVQKLKAEAELIAKSSSVEVFLQNKTTLVYDTNGALLCKLKSDKDMYYVYFQDMPTAVGNAFVVMEDRDFYQHSGVDYKAILRATIENQKSNEIVQGASTITQQLARNIFLTQDVTWERKIEEMFLASALEERYSKEQILEFYLNNIYFGNGYYGIDAAARGYFGRPVAKLSLSEQVFLAAIPNNPTKYNPLNNFENTLKRRDLILHEMYMAGYIGSMDYYTAVDSEVILNPQKDSQVDNSIATYVRHCATRSLMDYYGFNFRNNFQSDEDYDRYQDQYETMYTQCMQKLVRGGYTIETSIDPKIQALLQKAVDEQLVEETETSKDGVFALQGAATCIDNATGNVVAIVGGRSQDLGGLTLNRAYQSYRQSGSAIKPLSVYMPYLMKGNNANTIVHDVPIENAPNNYDGAYLGDITLREALKYSRNVPAWSVYQEITPRSGTNFLMQMDFKKIWPDRDYSAGALGGFTYGATSEEMAGAFATIANGGVFRTTTCVVRIYGVNGDRLVDESYRGERVYDAKACMEMTDILQSVMEPGGTGQSAAVDGVPIAGKTGTTNSVKDIWMCGYSAYYTTAVWVGYDMPKMLGYDRYALRIFHQYMESVHQGLPAKEFFGSSEQWKPETPSNPGAPEEIKDDDKKEKEEDGGPVIAPDDLGGAGSDPLDPDHLKDPDAGGANNGTNSNGGGNNGVNGNAAGNAGGNTGAGGDRDANGTGGDRDANIGKNPWDNDQVEPGDADGGDSGIIDSDRDANIEITW